MMNRKTLLGCVTAGVALTLAGPFTASAAEPAIQRDAAYETLRHGDTFAMGGVGIAGTMSASEKALHDVLARKDAVASFESLLREGGPTGKLYALIGLRWTKAPSYKQTAADILEQKSTDVKNMSGCVLMRTPVATIVKDIDKGLYDNRKEPVKVKPRPAR